MPSAAAKARKSKSKHQDKNRQRKHQNLDDITVEDVEQREAAAAEAKLGTAEEQAIENARVAAELMVANESKHAATDIEKAREAQALINADARNVTGSLGTGALTTACLEKVWNLWEMEEFEKNLEKCLKNFLTIF